MSPVSPSTINPAGANITRRFHSLQEWLSWQQKLHFTSIDLGLERCRQVAADLDLLAPPYRIITVAGTNGKGSSSMMLEMMMRKAGYRTGCYTSPHLVRYNERILVDGVEVDDEVLCRSFSRIDQARGDISLTYFEFGTLAALDIFNNAGLDLAILEVGLGGRLDAVNMMDADVVLLCTIDFDHVRWLGHDRNCIGYEKAGVFRPLRPAVCADSNPPESIINHAAVLGTELFVSGRDFTYQLNDDTWSWQSRGANLDKLPRPDPYNNMQVHNAAAVLKVLELVAGEFPVATATVIEVLSGFRPAGRCQVLQDVVPMVFDVAHNPQAMENLRNCLEKMPPARSTHMVIGFLNDKDYQKMLQILCGCGDFWYLVTLDDARSLAAGILVEILARLGITEHISAYENVADAMSQARAQSRPGDRIIVTGSFVTVGAAMSWLNAGN
jgi:dihydrofolate synthase/folylpolyglutamate synthase